MRYTAAGSAGVASLILFAKLPLFRGNMKYHAVYSLQETFELVMYFFASKVLCSAIFYVNGEMQLPLAREESVEPLQSYAFQFNKL